MPGRLTRRSFLSYLLAGAATVVLLPKYAFGIISPNIIPEDKWFSFSTQQGVGPWLSESTLTQRYCALHKETTLPDIRVKQNDSQKIVSLLEKTYTNQGLHWKNSNRIVWSYQHYGICDPSIYSKRLLSYSRMAQDYLYSHVSGLMEIDLEWDLLIRNHTRTYITTRGYRGFVGKHTYLIYRVYGVEEDGTRLHPGLVIVKPVERAINYIVDDNDHNPVSSTIFVIHGQTSLISPFTEIINLSTHQPTLRLVSELEVPPEENGAQITGRVYGESITRAAGILLALSYLKKYGHTDEEALVMELSQSLSNQYPIVQGAMAYMEQHGVQSVLDAYSDNPGSAMKKIIKSMAG